MSMLEQAKSALHMDNLIFERIEFSRKEAEVSLDSLTFGLKPTYIDIGDQQKKVILDCKVGSRENLFSIRVIMSAVFTIDGALPVASQIVEKNTVAIMFPYLRSQITILASQPNFPSIILPPLNINRLLEEINREE